MINEFPLRLNHGNNHMSCHRYQTLLSLQPITTTNYFFDHHYNYEQSTFLFALHHRFNLVRKEVLTSSGFNSFLIAVMGDQTVTLPIKFNANYY
jgi:hypothetical protein